MLMVTRLSEPQEAVRVGPGYTSSTRAQGVNQVIGSDAPQMPVSALADSHDWLERGKQSLPGSSPPE